MKISKRQRAQVVELLRCAADQNDKRRGAGLNGLFGATEDIGYGFRHRIDRLAWKARNAVSGVMPIAGRENYRTLLLEAAQRVEEGSWPQ